MPPFHIYETKRANGWGIDAEQKQNKKQNEDHHVNHSWPSSNTPGSLQSQRLPRHRSKVHLRMTARLRMVVRHVFTRSDAVNFHLAVVLKAAEQLGGDQEVLAAATTVLASRGACDVDKTGMHETGRMLVSWT